MPLDYTKYITGDAPRVRATGVRTGGNLPPLARPPVGTGGPLPPQTAPIPTTGGTLPPQTRVPTTGGPLPPLSGPIPMTGGNLPPNGNTGIVPPWLQTGGNLPPQVLTPGTGGNLPPQSGGGAFPGQVNTGGNLPPQSGGQVRQGSFAPGQVVNQMLNQFINGKYAQDARLRGIEQANDRGLLNSSIAAGNAERSAIEAVQPFVGMGMDLLGNRENRAFQGEQNQKDRDLRSKLQSDATFQQDWLADRSFNRDFYGTLSMMPIKGAYDLQQMMAQYALENPDVYTPNNMAGMQQFFNDSLRNIISQYFGGSGG